MQPILVRCRVTPGGAALPRIARLRSASSTSASVSGFRAARRIRCSSRIQVRGSNRLTLGYFSRIAYTYTATTAAPYTVVHTIALMSTPAASPRPRVVPTAIACAAVRITTAAETIVSSVRQAEVTHFGVKWKRVSVRCSVVESYVAPAPGEALVSYCGCHRADATNAVRSRRPFRMQ